MKMTFKSKSVSKPDQKNHLQRNDLSDLAGAIIANAGVGIYILQYGQFVYVSQLDSQSFGNSTPQSSSGRSDQALASTEKSHSPKLPLSRTIIKCN
jgi:hypothetical protein